MSICGGPSVSIRKARGTHLPPKPWGLDGVSLGNVLGSENTVKREALIVGEINTHGVVFPRGDSRFKGSGRKTAFNCGRARGEGQDVGEKPVSIQLLLNRQLRDFFRGVNTTATDSFRAAATLVACRVGGRFSCTVCFPAQGTMGHHQQRLKCQE